MKKDNIFWIGYSDLMTSLFFVMLVLFVVTVGYLNNSQRELKEALVDLENTNIELNITVDQQEKILKIEDQFKPLEESGYFYYLENCKKYIVKDLMGIEIFNPNLSTIKNEYVSITVEIGNEIQKFLKQLSENNPELSYLLVIEGNMANKYDNSISQDNIFGYTKSYERALAVYNLWQRNNIHLRQYNTEVLICGSGFNGLCRDDIEENNKRFSIQIIPKIQNKIENE
ncbi:MAG: hypothetical protein GXZ10_13820 [Gammaproteobacteria bacterium]|nr:hypothetical protein [Gammaproteobacteria bacterium]